MSQSFLPIKKLGDEPFASILGYPLATKRQLTSRITELAKLGISSVSFEGDTKLGKLDVLGKGYVGIVVLAKKRSKKGPLALKIRRIDSQRQNLKAEAQLLQKANDVGVGPTFYTNSKNFLVMEYLDGKKIGEYINNISQKKVSSHSIKKLKRTVRKVLEDCYKLDCAGLDHGELSSMSKHVIVNDVKATIIDFESSSTQRRVSNVTSATQGMFIGSGIAKKIRKIYKLPTKNKIIKSLQQYKQNPTQKTFDSILETLKL
jgi:putative serine/threonine protein kinase